MAEERSPSPVCRTLSPPPPPVFIDTNLDTHLAMIVAANDTVGDLKRKVAQEHAICFLKSGDITINSLKVRRKGTYYNLSDSMLVNSAFDGIKGTRFIHAEIEVVDTGEDVSRRDVNKKNFGVIHGPLHVSDLMHDSTVKAFVNCQSLPEKLELLPRDVLLANQVHCKASAEKFDTERHSDKHEIHSLELGDTLQYDSFKPHESDNLEKRDLSMPSRPEMDTLPVKSTKDFKAFESTVDSINDVQSVVSADKESGKMIPNLEDNSLRLSEKKKHKKEKKRKNYGACRVDDNSLLEGSGIENVVKENISGNQVMLAEPSDQLPKANVLPEDCDYVKERKKKGRRKSGECHHDDDVGAHLSKSSILRNSSPGVEMPEAISNKCTNVIKKETIDDMQDQIFSISANNKDSSTYLKLRNKKVNENLIDEKHTEVAFINEKMDNEHESKKKAGKGQRNFGVNKDEYIPSLGKETSGEIAEEVTADDPESLGINPQKESVTKEYSRPGDTHKRKKRSNRGKLPDSELKKHENIPLLGKETNGENAKQVAEDDPKILPINPEREIVTDEASRYGDAHRRKKKARKGDCPKSALEDEIVTSLAKETMGESSGQVAADDPKNLAIYSDKENVTEEVSRQIGAERRKKKSRKGELPSSEIKRHQIVPTIPKGASRENAEKLAANDAKTVTTNSQEEIVTREASGHNAAHQRKKARNTEVPNSELKKDEIIHSIGKETGENAERVAGYNPKNVAMNHDKEVFPDEASCPGNDVKVLPEALPDGQRSRTRERKHEDRLPVIKPIKDGVSSSSVIVEESGITTGNILEAECVFVSNEEQANHGKKKSLKSIQSFVEPLPVEGRSVGHIGDLSQRPLTEKGPEASNRRASSDAAFVSVATQQGADNSEGDCISKKHCGEKEAHIVNTSLIQPSKKNSRKQKSKSDKQKGANKLQTVLNGEDNENFELYDANIPPHLHPVNSFDDNQASKTDEQNIFTDNEFKKCVYHAEQNLSTGYLGTNSHSGQQRTNVDVDASVKASANPAASDDSTEEDTSNRDKLYCVALRKKVSKSRAQNGVSRSMENSFSNEAENIFGHSASISSADEFERRNRKDAREDFSDVLTTDSDMDSEETEAVIGPRLKTGLQGSSPLSASLLNKEVRDNEILMSQLSDAPKRRIALGDLLRSSQSYRKAKQARCQADDTESQPLDIVSETQPDCP